jgi:hypothetical protein
MDVMNETGSKYPVETGEPRLKFYKLKYNPIHINNKS